MTATTTEVGRRTRSLARPLASGRLRRRVGAVGVAAGVLLVPAWALAARTDAERAATTAAADAEEAASARRAAEDEVAAGLDGLGVARGDARTAAGDVAAQRAQLADLAIAEADLERVVAETRATTEDTEATRDATATRVQRQAVELPQLEACLVEVRRSLDRAFHATNNPRITVPPLSDTCRVLSTAAAGG
jgi:predicted NUDIX family NTP pyrophosphohydrolase